MSNPSPTNSFSKVLAFQSESPHTTDDLFSIFSNVMPGQKVQISEPVSMENSQNVRTSTQFKTALMLCGFVNITLDLSDDSTVVTGFASKPHWDINAPVVSLKKRKQPIKGGKKSDIWSNEVKKAQSGSNTNTTQIDPSSLDFDPAEPLFSEKVSKSDCSTKIAPCANCSCGRADELASSKPAPVRLDDSALPASSCGSCYLGDSFRCPSCPYKGLPAFEPGEIVQIELE